MSPTGGCKDPASPAWPWSLDLPSLRVAVVPLTTMFGGVISQWEASLCDLDEIVILSVDYGDDDDDDGGGDGGGDDDEG